MEGTHKDHQVQLMLMNISGLCQERNCGDGGGVGLLGLGGNPLEDYDNVLNIGF